MAPIRLVIPYAMASPATTSRRGSVASAMKSAVIPTAMVSRPTRAAVRLSWNE